MFAEGVVCLSPCILYVSHVRFKGMGYGGEVPPLEGVAL